MVHYSQSCCQTFRKSTCTAERERERERQKKREKACGNCLTFRSSVVAKIHDRRPRAVSSSVLLAHRKTGNAGRYKCCAARNANELQRGAPHRRRPRAHVAHVTGKAEGVVCVTVNDMLSTEHVNCTRVGGGCCCSLHVQQKKRPGRYVALEVRLLAVSLNQASTSMVFRTPLGGNSSRILGRQQAEHVQRVENRANPALLQDV